jgi:hypothetical protein
MLKHLNIHEEPMTRIYLAYKGRIRLGLVWLDDVGAACLRHRGYRLKVVT